MAVLDSRSEVRGVAGLRVVDASVFPHSPGDFSVTTTFLASFKAAAVILEDIRIHRSTSTWVGSVKSLRNAVEKLFIPSSVELLRPGLLCEPANDLTLLVFTRNGSKYHSADPESFVTQRFLALGCGYNPKICHLQRRI